MFLGGGESRYSHRDRDRDRDYHHYHQRHRHTSFNKWPFHMPPFMSNSVNPFLYHPGKNLIASSNNNSAARRTARPNTSTNTTVHFPETASSPASTATTSTTSTSTAVATVSSTCTHTSSSTGAGSTASFRNNHHHYNYKQTMTNNARQFHESSPSSSSSFWLSWYSTWLINYYWAYWLCMSKLNNTAAPSLNNDCSSATDTTVLQPFPDTANKLYDSSAQYFVPATPEYTNHDNDNLHTPLYNHPYSASSCYQNYDLISNQKSGF